jgi:hypothetical protein
MNKIVRKIETKKYRLSVFKFEARNSKQSQMTKFQMFEMKKNLKNLNFENSNLFRLPARSRFGEGRDFDIRISDFQTQKACLIPAMQG